MTTDIRPAVKRKALGEGPTKLVESTNRLTPDEFFQRYLPRKEIQTLSSKLNLVENQLEIVLEGANALSQNGGAILDQCLDLIEFTSRDDYQNSEVKWSSAKKKREMRLPDMRYVVLVEASTETGVDAVLLKVAGFISFMVTYEDGHEVIYCYEIHLVRKWQGKGIGKTLMEVVERIGLEVGLEKAMLTVFKSNERAVSIYESLGYSQDEYSPGPRRLRNGTVKEPKYVILSKVLR